MKDLQPSDKGIVVVGLLCVVGLLLAGQWVSHRPPPRVVIAPTAAPAPTATTVPTPVPTPTPLPPLGPLSIAVRNSNGVEIAGLPAPARVLNGVIQMPSGDTIEKEEWSVLRCFWLPKAKGKWQIYTGGNPPFLWNSHHVIVGENWNSQRLLNDNTHKTFDTAFIYAPIGHWKMDIQLDTTIRHYGGDRTRQAIRTIEFIVDMKTLRLTSLSQAKLAPFNPQTPQRIAKLQYKRNSSYKGYQWHDAPQSGKPEFPLFVRDWDMVWFRAVKAKSNLPWPSAGHFSPIFWNTQDDNSAGDDLESLVFEKSAQPIVISAQCVNVKSTLVCVLPKGADQ